MPSTWTYAPKTRRNFTARNCWMLLGSALGSGPSCRRTFPYLHFSGRMAGPIMLEHGCVEF